MLQYQRSHNGVWIEFETEQVAQLPVVQQWLPQGGGGAGTEGVEVPPSLAALAPSLTPGRRIGKTPSLTLGALPIWLWWCCYCWSQRSISLTRF